MNKLKSSKNQFPLKYLIWISLAVVLIFWSANFFLIGLDNTERGVFGDMFGVVNSLFSGLAFAGIIVTIYLQRNELQLQREELAETREEFKIQNATLRLQRFENTFFNMLSLHHEIVNNIDYRVEEARIKGRNISHSIPTRVIEVVDYKGRDVFELHYSELSKQLRDYTEHGDINDNYKLEYEKYENDFDHYYRNLYRIIKLVDETQFTNKPNSLEEFKEKYKYTSIVRAQLSTFELLWLFYNCLSENGKDKFKPLVEKYTLFKNIRKKELANGNHEILFESSAFRKEDNVNFYE